MEPWPARLPPDAVTGHTVLGVTAHWHQFSGQRGKWPLSVWLHLDDLSPVRLHTSSGLIITVDEVADSCDMGECGSLVVEHGAPAFLAARIGERVEATRNLRQDPQGFEVGVVLQFANGAVGVADVGDDLVVAEWPSAEWTRRGISLAPRAPLTP